MTAPGSSSSLAQKGTGSQCPRSRVDWCAVLPSARSESGGHVPLELARRLTGRCARIAQVVHIAIPFSASLWAALAAATPLMGSQMVHSPILFPLRRVLWAQFPSPPLDDGLHCEIQTDASPWGGGGLLLQNGCAVSAWHCAWEPEHLAVLNAIVGESAHQTSFEILAVYIGVLLATRAWDFQTWPCPLLVCTDNVAALNAFRLKCKGPALAIARELALILAWKQIPLQCRHLPAVHNTRADALSRLSA
eukprot:6132899-Amphidinium_carterae.1